jgi:general secretion pathway protein I
MSQHNCKRDVVSGKSISSQRGFTLLEVMVALAVVAIALAALVKGGSQSAVTAAHLRDKSFAHWVAMNRVAELSLQPQWPATGESRSDEEMAKRRWYALAKISATDDADVRRLEVEVRGSEEKDDAVLARVTAFLPRPNSDGQTP